jgi:hypothetical protein
MRVTHTRRAAIAVLSLLKADAYVRRGHVNALRLHQLLWAKSQLRHFETFPQAARERLGLVVALLGLRLLALAEVISKRPPTAPAVEPPIGEPTPRLRYGLDEHNRVEFIDVTPTGLEDQPVDVPAQTCLALLAPSANQTTTTSKRKPKAADRAAKFDAAKQLLAEGKPLRAVARDLQVPESTLRSWRKKFLVGAAV